jgi:uncharacterized Ntn-hydrolase superfamily protein
MTWSVIARDEATGRVGIIVASRFFAVGAAVPYIATGFGAVASQAFINPYYGPRGLTLLREGKDAAAVVAGLTGPDAGRAHRQLHVMDAKGQFAAHTGADCIDWCGHLIGKTASVAGNMLAGPDVIAATLRTYEAKLTMPLGRRLILAMQAGEYAGGDKRGKQSIALLIHDGEDYPLYNIRVDDHADPLAELTRLYDIARQRYIHFRRRMPSAAAPAGNTDRRDIDAFVARSIAEGYE